jgi:hypothetical protein
LTGNAFIITGWWWLKVKKELIKQAGKTWSMVDFRGGRQRVNLSPNQDKN